MSLLSQGWAIRRNKTCLLAIEVDCGNTLGPFHACCPTGYACPTQYNVACCNPGTNCTTEINDVKQPPCANATWSLFNNNGYFCCDRTQNAFDRGGTNVCANPGVASQSGDQSLTVVRTGIDLATFTPSSTLTPVSLTATATSSSDNSAKKSSTPIGAIVGGVVGGIAFIAVLVLLAWYLRRRGKQNTATQVTRPHDPYDPYKAQQGELQQNYGDTVKYSHLADSQVLQEADGVSTQVSRPSELPTQQSPVELHGNAATH